jgi:hypothetical protein
MSDLINEIVKNLKKLADNLDTLSKDLKEAPEVDKAKESKEEIITLEKVRAVLADKSREGKQAEVKDLIVKYGANKLTALDQACYKDLLKEAETL